MSQTSPPPTVAAAAAAIRPIALKNGSVLMGTVEKESGGKLYLQVDLLGSMIVDASARSQEPVKTDPARVIVLKNGTRLVGRISREEHGKVYVDADLLGPVVIDKASFAPRGR